jgi:ankyrin repeat protein
MKSKTNSLNQTHITKVIRITFLSLVIMLSSCKDNKVSAQDKTNTEAKTPKIDIHTAVVTNDIETIKQHIQAKSNINEKDKTGGSSPLISAALFGKTEIAKMLIDAGADLNIQNNDGSTALITSAFFCRPQIVKVLLDKKADKTLKNNYNQTAYDAVSGSFDTVKPSYEALGQMLQPMGLKLDLGYIEKTRPEIALMLK